MLHIFPCGYHKAYIKYLKISSVQSFSCVRLFVTPWIGVTQSLFVTPMDWSTPGFPVHHQLPQFTQTHVHHVGDAIQPSHPLSSPSSPAFNLSQHQDLFQLVSSLHPEKAVAPYSSTLAWRIPWTEEPGRLQSMGSLKVGHDWVTSLSLFTFMHWRRKWQPTPVCLPGESQGRGSLGGCRLCGRTESDMTERT